MAWTPTGPMNVGFDSQGTRASHLHYLGVDAWASPRYIISLSRRGIRGEYKPRNRGTDPSVGYAMVNLCFISSRYNSRNLERI